jgi:hypothetical protein
LCTYVLTDPSGKGIDHILHEQQIHNCVAVRDMNIVIPDNQFPVDNLNFSGLDLDLIQSFEIHILKDTFKSTFGVEFRPGRKDIIYICDINQLWEVEQMFPKRGFMNAEAYYRVLCKKYNDRKSRTFATTDEGQNAKTFIEDLTAYTTLDKLFDIDVNAEINMVTKNLNNNSVQNPSEQYTATSLLTVRKNMTAAVITPHHLWNASLTVSKSMYKMPVKSKGVKLVEYNNVDQNLGLADNRAFSFWLKADDYDPSWSWTLLSNYDSVNHLGYSVTMLGGALTFRLNANTWSLPLQGFTVGTWYSFLINVDQVQGKLEMAVYTRQSENGVRLTDSTLVLFQKMIFDIVPTVFVHSQEIYLGGVDTMSNLGNRNSWYITNIRIYTQVIDKTARQTVLNQNVVGDSQLTLLVDAAEILQLHGQQYGNL